jgi:hypothetical protein
MKILECKCCGNTEFMEDNTSEIICNCGMKMARSTREEPNQDKYGFIESALKLSSTLPQQISLS